MRDGTDRCNDGAIQKLASLHLKHILKSTKDSLCHLLSFIENEFDINSFAQPEYNSLVDLCANNLQLLNKLQVKLLQKNEDQFQSSTPLGEKVLPLCEKHHEFEQEFRESLVALMMLSLQVWELCLHKSKIELAEESKIWRVHIDNGSLRARSMDRYLGLDKLPKAPRWRDVIKTAYFVLEKIELDCPVKRELQEQLERTLGVIRQRSLYSF